jgi:L-lactate dehydrogenase complex protein LldG
VVEAPVSAAREDVLARVRAALGPSPRPPAVPRAYRAAGSIARDGVVELFCERAAEYRATVRRVAPHELDAAIRAALAGEQRVAASPAAPGGFPAGRLDIAQLDQLDAVVTGAALAIADTGTIVLDSGPESGPRALTLVPDHHVCIVRADTIVPSVPDAVAALAEAARDGRPITLVSGPSATSDIELDRVEGVHGPRRLDVLVCG